MTRVFNVAGAAVAVLVLTLTAPAWAGPDEDALRTWLNALERTAPGSAAEDSLLGEIGALVRSLQGQPVPEEFHRRMARGEAFVEAASDKQGFQQAVREFEAAAKAAPWLADAYYNLGVVQDKAGLFDAAMRSIKIYVAAAPDAPDARKVRNLIYKIEARKEQAGQAQAAERAAAAKRQRQEQARAAEEERQRQADERLAAQLVGRWRNPPGGRIAFQGCVWNPTVQGSLIDIEARGTRVTVTIVGMPHLNTSTCKSYYTQANFRLFEATVKDGGLVGTMNRYLGSPYPFESEIRMAPNGRSFKAAVIKPSGSSSSAWNATWVK